MSEVTIQCPYCGGGISVDPVYNGQFTDCPYCQKQICIQIPGPAVNAPASQYGQVPPQQYAPPQQQYASPQYGQAPQQYAPPPQYGGMPPAGYGGAPFQGVGAQFQLMPGEYLLSRGGMQRCIFPAGNTYMRLTNQRLTFCHISRGLTIFVSWLFMFSEATTISQTFTRNDIANMELRPGFLRKKLAITDHYGQTFEFCSNGFSDELVLRILNWWQTGN